MIPFWILDFGFWDRWYGQSPQLDLPYLQSKQDYNPDKITERASQKFDSVDPGTQTHIAKESLAACLVLAHSNVTLMRSTIPLVLILLLETQTTQHCCALTCLEFLLLDPVQ
jgi:hypothetical protein